MNWIYYRMGPVLLALIFWEWAQEYLPIMRLQTAVLLALGHSIWKKLKTGTYTSSVLTSHRSPTEDVVNRKVRVSCCKEQDRLCVMCRWYDPGRCNYSGMFYTLPLYHVNQWLQLSHYANPDLAVWWSHSTQPSSGFYERESKINEWKGP